MLVAYSMLILEFGLFLQWSCVNSSNKMYDFFVIKTTLAILAPHVSYQILVKKVVNSFKKSNFINKIRCLLSSLTLTLPPVCKIKITIEVLFRGLGVQGLGT